MMIHVHVAGTNRSRATITDAAGISKTTMSAATRSEAEEVDVRGTTMVAASRGPRYSHDSHEYWLCTMRKQRSAIQSAMSRCSHSLTSSTTHRSKQLVQNVRSFAIVRSSNQYQNGRNNQQINGIQAKRIQDASLL